MGTDNAQLLATVGQEIVDGLRNEIPNFDDRVCTVRNVDAISGTIPYLADKDTMGKDLGSKAVGADPTPIDMDLSSVTYKLERYSHSISMDKSQVQDLDQYMSTFGEVAKTLMEYNAVARSADLAALLTDSGSNGQHSAANGAWSVSTSTPVLDIQQAKYADAPRADMCIIGSQSALELMRHPDITAMAGLGYASGGGIPREALRSIIGQLLGIGPDAVHVFEDFYNSAKFGQSAALAYVTTDFFWLGEKAKLLKIAQNGGQGVVTVETDHLKTDTACSDTCDFIRVQTNTFSATEITGL